MFMHSTWVARVLAACVLASVAAHAGAAASAETPPPQGEAAAGSAPTVIPARRTNRLVYACRDGGIPMFSDRPCGESSLLRSLEVYTPARAGRAPSTEAEPAKATTRPAVAPREAVRALKESAEKCERLQQSLDDVDDRMRAGYPARQAAQIWQRWRDARSALREAGC